MGDELRRFEKIFLPHLESAFNLARWIVQQDQDAQDVVQEAYLRAFKGFRGFRGDNGRAWFLKIVRNTAYTWINRHAADEKLVPYEEERYANIISINQSAGVVTIEQRKEYLQIALDRLPVEYREVMPVYKPPRTLEAKIRESLRKESLRGQFLRFPGLRPSAYAAAAVLIGFAAGWYLRTTPTRTDLVYEAIENHARSLLASHLVDVPSGDQHTVKPWFTGKLDFSPPVLDCADTRFPLIGGRVDMLEKRPVAAIVYKHGNHFVNLFIWPVSNHPVDLNVQTDRGYQFCGWNTGGLNYFCISEISRADLVSFAEAIQAH